MITGMLRGVRSLYKAICVCVVSSIVGILVSLVIFHFQGRTLKNVKDDLLNDLETLNSQYKTPTTLPEKLNHFEKNYRRYMETANDYCRLLVHCKKLNTSKNRKKLEAELKKYNGKEWLNEELEQMLILMEKIEENKKKI